jgi:PAS domain S-box-containing protein
MKTTQTLFGQAIHILIIVLVAVGLYLTRLYSFLLFHSLAELFSIVVAWGIFVLAWNARQQLENHYFLLVGIASLFIGGIDLLHTLAYKGMGVFPGFDANLPTQLWIAARYLQSLSLLVAPFFIHRKLKPWLTAAVFAVVTILLVGSIFLWGIFPDCYVEGQGLTPFKKASEYVISLILLLSLVRLLQWREAFDPKVLRLLGWCIVATIISELAFTFYVGVYDFSNMMGHYFKIGAFFLLHIGIIETGFRKPYDLIFRELKQSEELLQEGQKHFRTVADFTYACEYWLRPDGSWAYVSPSCERITGYSAEEFAQDPGLLERIIHPDDVALYTDHLTTELEGEGRCSLEFRIIKCDGEVRWIAHEGQSVYDTDGTWLGRRLSNRDITERKLAEEQLQHYAEELARSNQDLEQFAYVASHDLQEPLRMVVSYLELLERRSRDQLDEKSVEYIDFAVDGAKRMQQMTQDLLAFSRVGTRGKSLAPTDSAAVLEEVLLGLKVAIEESGAEITHTTLPTVLADDSQLGQLFQNLISNAIKFRGVARPQVHISAELEGDKVKFAVRDNGIGIAPQFHERIFLIFQRLHTREEYEGTGIGLAICKKILQRHGGRIWLESEVGHGTTFYFTLPAIEAE